MDGDHIDAILTDFRTWLSDLPDPQPPPAEPAPPKLDVAGVVGHFTALRQEVNLLTKSARAALEQNGQLLAELKKPAPTEPAVHTQPLVKALLDIADALAGAVKSMEKSKATLTALPDAMRFVPLPAPPEGAARPGFLARLFGRTPDGEDSAWRDWAEQVAEAQAENAAVLDDAETTFAPLLAGLGDGYAISLRRIERLLPQYDLEAIPAVGLPFDPEFMEAVELVACPSGSQPGVVVEEVRRGWLRSGAVFRFAVVKVAR